MKSTDHYRLKWSKLVDWGTVPTTLTLVLYAFVQTWIFGSRFGTNDDLGMAQIANGGITGKPSGYTIFLNIFLGKFLQICYQMFPGIQWYPFLQVASMAFAFAVFMRVGIIALKFVIPDDLILRICFASTLLIIVFSQFSVWVYTINFSTTAYFCSVIGLSTLFLSLRINPSSIALYPIYICLLGFLWRPQAFISVVPVFLLLLVFQFRRIPYISVFKNISLLAFVAFLASYLDRLAHTSSGKWRVFYEYNLMRGRLHGNHVFDLLIDRNGFAEIASRLRIPEINLRFFGAWFYSNATTKVDSLARANQLVDENTVISKIQIGPIALSQARGIFLVVAPLTFLILLFYSRKRLAILSLFSIHFAYLMLTESYLEQFIRLPSYVIEGFRFSALVCLILILMFTSVSAANSFSLSHYKKFFVFISILPFALYSIHLIQVLPEFSKSTKLQQRQSLKIVQGFQNAVSLPTIDFAGLIDLSSTSPWSSFKFTSLKLIPTGWIMSSPHQESRLNFFGISDSLDEALAAGKISVLSSQNSLILVDLAEYLHVNYKVCGTWDSAAITFLDQPVLLSVFRVSDECGSEVNSDPQLEQSEVFYTNDEVHLKVSTCTIGATQNQISFKAYSPFGIYAEDFRIKIDYLGLFMAPTTRYVTVKPGDSQKLIVKTWGCDVQITSLSPPVVPFDVNPKIPDRRTLFIGISDLTILDK